MKLNFLHLQTFICEICKSYTLYIDHAYHRTTCSILSWGWVGGEGEMVSPYVGVLKVTFLQGPKTCLIGS